MKEHIFIDPNNLPEKLDVEFFNNMRETMRDELKNAQERGDEEEVQEIRENIEKLNETVASLEQMEREVAAFRKFMKQHDPAIQSLYGDDRSVRYAFIERLTVTDYETLFNESAPEGMQEALDMPARNNEEREQKAIALFQTMGVMELVLLYERIMFSNVYTYPSSSATGMINKILSSVASGRLPEGATNGELQTVKTEDGKIQFIHKSKRDVVIVTMSHNEILFPSTGSGRRGGRQNRDLRKIFAFILVKCAEQGFRSPVVFSIHDMVDAGMYANYSNARKGIIKNIEIIYNCLDYSIKQVSGKNNEVKGIGGGHGFISSYKILKGNPYVTLNIDPNFNIQTLATFYTILPKWAFSLDASPFALLEYVFRRGRQSCKSIMENGYFNINMDVLRDNLGLPPFSGEDDYSKIRRPIMTAIEKVEEAALQNGDKDIKLTPILKGGDIDSAPIRAWLHNGYLQVTLTGDYAQRFADVEKSRIRKIETAKRNGQKARARKEKAEAQKQPEPTP